MATIHGSMEEILITDTGRRSREKEEVRSGAMKLSQEGAAREMGPEQEALRELADLGVRFAVLRRPPSWEDAGDIDVLAPDVEAIDKALLDIGYVRYSASPSSRKYLKYEYTFGRWIHLDVQPTLFFGAIEAPRPFFEFLLKGVSCSSDGIPCLDPIDEGLLLLFHLALEKGRLRSKYDDRLSSIASETIRSRTEIYGFLPKGLDEYVRVLDAVHQGSLSERRAVRTIRQSFNLRRSRRSLWSSGAGVGRRLRRLLRGPRPIIFVGPDGSGKSTLTEPLGRLRWPAIRRQYMGPARESEMRAGFGVMVRFLDSVRQRFSKTHPVGFLARGLWQLTCYCDLLERVLRHMPFWSRNGVVIFDRYACDMYFRKPTTLNEFLFIRLFPRPRFAFLCVGDPDAIHRRKNELTPDEVSRTIALYRRQLGRCGIIWKEINTTDAPPDKALSEAVRYLVDTNWFRDCA